MYSRHRPDTRIILALIVVLFLGAMAWWWSLRAGRLEAGLAPTPATNPAATPAAPVVPVPR